MKTLIRTQLIFLAILLGVASAPAQGPEPGEEPAQSLPEVDFQPGPSAASLGSVAEVQVPQGYVFADAKNTRKLMEAMQNTISGNELGFLAPASTDWFIIFEFDDVGYVKDSEKDSLDANAMLNSIRKGTEQANKQRARNGWGTMKIVGWEQAPQYNQQTQRLEWAIRGESEDGGQVVNWNTRLLGRGGVMRATLVGDPDATLAALPQFNALLGGFGFKQGHRYAEFRQGDKTAKYGLSALVVGGAAAVAVKSGAAKAIWKLMVAAFALVGGFFKKLFGGKKDASAS